MSETKPAAAVAAPAPHEILIRTKGTRRQAYYRATGTLGWHDLQVPKAIKALKAGLLQINGKMFPAVVSRETHSGATA